MRVSTASRELCKKHVLLNVLMCRMHGDLQMNYEKLRFMRFARHFGFCDIWHSIPTREYGRPHTTRAQVQPQDTASQSSLATPRLPAPRAAQEPYYHACTSRLQVSLRVSGAENQAAFRDALMVSASSAR